MNKTTWTTTKPHPRTWMLPPAGWAYLETRNPLDAAVAAFDPIDLAEMDDVALLNRIDTKFVLTHRQLLDCLAELQPHYRMLEVDGQRLNRYRTLYFDTPGFGLFHAHVNDRPERYKVRSREYVDSNLAFLEVKHRTRKDRTIKSRLLTPQVVLQINPGAADWLQGVCPLDGAELEPKLWNTFTRLTLVSKCCCERVTLDLDLSFTARDRQAALDGLVVIEVKTDRSNGQSDMINWLHARRIREKGFSKYAIGVSLLYEQVKKNALKPRLLWIEKMMQAALAA